MRSKLANAQNWKVHSKKGNILTKDTDTLYKELGSQFILFI